MTDLDTYLEDLMYRVCTDLARIYESEEQSSTYGLIFPKKRDGTVRISEQEAKLLFVQHLTIDQCFFFSVETPTIETYTQKGSRPMSARTDLTLFDPNRKPVAHIELKAHTCSIEAVRKDLEKLLREQTAGMWFHTLHRANRHTLDSLRGKFRSAFSQLPECLHTNGRTYLVAFFTLDDAVLHWQWLRLLGDGTRNCAAIAEIFGHSIQSSSWMTKQFRGKRTGAGLNAPWEDRQAGPGRKGRREGFFVFAPNLVSGTVLHLSVRGGSYKLRLYDLTQSDRRPHAFTIPACRSFAALRASGAIVEWIPVSAEDLKHNVDCESEYWCERIREVNDQRFSVADSS